jgi:hypothetical protein
VVPIDPKPPGGFGSTFSVGLQVAVLFVRRQRKWNGNRPTGSAQKGIAE